MEKLVENIVYWIRESGKGCKDAGPEIVIDEQVLGFLEINFVKSLKFPPKVKIAINDMCM